MMLNFELKSQRSRTSNVYWQEQKQNTAVNVFALLMMLNFELNLQRSLTPNHGPGIKKQILVTPIFFTIVLGRNLNAFCRLQWMEWITPYGGSKPETPFLETWVWPTGEPWSFPWDLSRELSQKVRQLLSCEMVAFISYIHGRFFLQGGVRRVPPL